jgi:CRP-like cAMP-binding protein
VSSELPINLLLESLPLRERNKILKRCESVELIFGTTLCDPGKAFQHVYFPCTGFISLVTTVEGHPPLEIGLIGNEGMLGVTMVLGVNTVPLQGIVQGAGSALRMTTKQFLYSLRDCPKFLPVLKRYLYVFIGQLSQTTACTHFHEVEARLGRWLLLAHDRAHVDHFHFTHQILANALGVQRSAVTIAAGMLQKRKLIRYIRGDIRILNRKGLEAASCECYQAVMGNNSKMIM